MAEKRLGNGKDAAKAEAPVLLRKDGAQPKTEDDIAGSESGDIGFHARNVASYIDEYVKSKDDGNRDYYLHKLIIGLCQWKHFGTGTRTKVLEFVSNRIDVRGMPQDAFAGFVGIINDACDADGTKTSMAYSLKAEFTLLYGGLLGSAAGNTVAMHEPATLRKALHALNSSSDEESIKRNAEKAVEVLERLYFIVDKESHYGNEYRGFVDGAIDKLRKGIRDCDWGTIRGYLSGMASDRVVPKYGRGYDGDGYEFSPGDMITNEWNPWLAGMMDRYVAVEL